MMKFTKVSNWRKLVAMICECKNVTKARNSLTFVLLEMMKSYSSIIFSLEEALGTFKDEYVWSSIRLRKST
jgi:hypothetical protein